MTACRYRPYRVGQVVAVVHLCWVDINFGHSTTFLILLGQLEVWQNGLWCRAGIWNKEIRVNQT